MHGRSIPALVAVALALTFATTVSAANPRVLSANSATYTDAPGDSGVAPDVTAVRVTNDNAGAIVLRITLGNRLQLVAGDFVAVYIDADLRPTTGDAGGTDYVLVSGGSSGLCRFRMRAAADCGGPQGAFAASFGDGVLTFSLRQGDIGRTRAFIFYVSTTNRTLSTSDRDFASDADQPDFLYTVRTPAPCRVPNVVRTTYSSAAAAILRAGCTLGRITYRFSRTVRSGNVIGQKPRARSRVRSGSGVTLVISRGRR